MARSPSPGPPRSLTYPGPLHAGGGHEPLPLRLSTATPGAPCTCNPRQINTLPPGCPGRSSTASTSTWRCRRCALRSWPGPPNLPPGTAYQYYLQHQLLAAGAGSREGRWQADSGQDYAGRGLFRPLGLRSTLLPAATSNTIPPPFSHGYLYGSTSEASVGTPPYSPDFKRHGRRPGKPAPRLHQPEPFLCRGGRGRHCHRQRSRHLGTGAGCRATCSTPPISAGWLDSLKPEDPKKPNGQQYGYGVAQMRSGPMPVYFHGGETPGYNSFIGYDPASLRRWWCGPI